MKQWMKQSIILSALVVCLASMLGCRNPTAVSNSQTTVAQKTQPQPSVCAVENVSRAALLRAKQTPTPALTPAPR